MVDPLLIQALLQLRAGGRAFEQGAQVLFRHYYPRFVRHFVLNGLCDAEAREIASEAMLKVIRGLDGLQDDAALNGWVWRVARNTHISHLRATHDDRRNEIYLDEDAWSGLLDTMANNNEFDVLTKLCLTRQLEEFEREHPERLRAIELVAMEGLDLPTLAEVLGRSYQASKEYLSQCRKYLLEFLKPCLED